MWIFLQRLVGTSPEHREAEKRYKESLQHLEERGQELQSLRDQVKEEVVRSQETTEAYSKSAEEMAQLVKKIQSSNPPPREERDEEEERPHE